MNVNRRAIALVGLPVALLLLAVACGGDKPAPEASPTTSQTTAPAAAPTVAPTSRASGPSRVEGFGEVAFRVQGSQSNAARRCALLAETAAQQGQGLMHRQDLAGYDGMLFVFGQDTTEQFWMKDTPLPLSIAFFDAGGRFVSSTDMEPCLDRPTCPLYAAAGPYRFALEVPKGGLGPLGIGPASVISVGGSCT